MFGLNGLHFHDFFAFSKIKSTRANHRYKLYLKAAKVNCYKYSFSIRIVKEWNDLPIKYIVEAGTFTLFKSRLKLHMNV